MVGDDLISVLGNKYNPEILSAADEPKSAKELSDELDIPIATCYRRINELEEAELLEVGDRPLSDQQRRTTRYERRIDEVDIDFRDGLSVGVKERHTSKSRLDDVWRKLSSSEN